MVEGRRGRSLHWAGRRDRPKQLTQLQNRGELGVRTSRNSVCETSTCLEYLMSGMPELLRAEAP